MKKNEKAVAIECISDSNTSSNSRSSSRSSMSRITSSGSLFVGFISVNDFQNQSE